MYFAGVPELIVVEGIACSSSSRPVRFLIFMVQYFVLKWCTKATVYAGMTKIESDSVIIHISLDEYSNVAYVEHSVTPWM